MYKQKETFTHFISIPFISKSARSVLGAYQNNILFKTFKENEQKALTKNNPNLFHLTICMLSLTPQTKIKAKQILKNKSQIIRQILSDSKVTFTDLEAFKGRNKKVNILYLDVKMDKTYQKIAAVSDILIREMVKQEVINPSDLKSMHITYDHNKGLYLLDKLHLTMFRVNDKIENVDFEGAIQKSKGFLIKESLTLQSVDISTRFDYDQTQFYRPLERVNIN